MLVPQAEQPQHQSCFEQNEGEHRINSRSAAIVPAPHRKVEQREQQQQAPGEQDPMIGQRYRRCTAGRQRLLETSGGQPDFDQRHDQDEADRVADEPRASDARRVGVVA